MRNSVTSLNWVSLFEWYVVRRGSKNGHQNDMCLEEIGLCVQNMSTILSSIINIIGGDLYDHSITTRIFTLIFDTNSKNYEESGYGFNSSSVILMHKICVSYPRRKFVFHIIFGLFNKSNHIRPINLTRVL